MPLRVVAQSRYAKRRSCRPVTPMQASAPLARRAIARPRSVAGAQQCSATHRARRDVRTRQSVHQKLHPRGRSYRAVLDCFARQARCVHWLAVFVASDERLGRGSSILTRFVGFSCRSAARTSRARIAFGCRLLRRRSGTNSVSPRSSSGTAARDPCLIAPLAALASRGSRLEPAYFVVTCRR
jgi:hypothetical protein